jgi:hypothetical protein
MCGEMVYVRGHSSELVPFQITPYSWPCTERNVRDGAFIVANILL